MGKKDKRCTLYNGQRGRGKERGREQEKDKMKRKKKRRHCGPLEQFCTSKKNLVTVEEEG